MEVIHEASDNFESAIKSLELSDAANADLERSMLDAAVHTALIMLELSLYERIIKGFDMPITKREADDIEHSRWGKFMQNKTVLKYLGKINELEDLQSSLEHPEYIRSEGFANQKRRGLRVTPHEYCRQYEAYCKGFCLHQSGFIDEAVVHYSSALTAGGRISNNRVRLAALEAIELVIREKVDLEKKSKELLRRTKRNSVMKDDSVGWDMCKSIYKYLSHHYILRRSVVFIVDTEYDSVVYRDKAMKNVLNFFKNNLH